jgi:Phosphatidylinositol transfer protein
LQYNKALRYVIARVAESTTGETPGEGVEILLSEPFGADNVHGMREGGVHTEKLLRFRSRLPALLRRVIPSSVVEIHESSWFSNAEGSRCKTIYRNPFLGDRFYLSIDSNHVSGLDTEENAVELSGVELARREIVYLDIAANVPPKSPVEDPSTFLSQKTGRGRLMPGWWVAVKAEADVAVEAQVESQARADPKPHVQTDNDIMSSLAKADSAPLAGHAKHDLRLNRLKVTCSHANNAVAASLVDAKRVADDGDEATADTLDSTSPASATSAASCESSVSDADSEIASLLSDLKCSPIDSTQTMTCYKVVNVEFTGFGMRRFVQGWITRAVVPNGFVDVHRKLFCWMDDWFGLTLSQVEEVEHTAARNIRARFEKVNGARSPYTTGDDTTALTCATLK